MENQSYENHRDKIKSGDLLIWNKGEESFLTKVLLFIIRLFTMSEYSHVGIAWKVSNRVFVIEASIPRVRITPLSSHSKFYHIPMKVKWNKERESYLLSKVGEPYSIIEAINGYLGNTDQSDNRWQCAELANMFYKTVGIDLGEAYTPSKLVRTILEQTSAEMTYIDLSKSN